VLYAESWLELLYGKFESSNPRSSGGCAFQSFEKNIFLFVQERLFGVKLKGTRAGFCLHYEGSFSLDFVARGGDVYGSILWLDVSIDGYIAHYSGIKFRYIMCFCQMLEVIL
jgi:hypothetical protein